MITIPLTTEEQDLMIKNMGLVRYIANQYIGKTQSMDYNDLVQSGYFGLLKAMEGYDESLGYTFGTYATYSIHRAIIRAIRNEDKMIRLPDHLYTVYNNYRHSGQNIPTFCEEQGLNETIFRRIVILMKPYVSLDQPIIKDGLEIEDYITMIKDDSPTTEQQILYKELKNEMNKIFAELITEGANPRNIEMVKRYYGSDDTLDVIGKDYGLSRERVRQIIAKVLKHVKIKLQRRNLEDYLHDSYLQDFISMES